MNKSLQNKIVEVSYALLPKATDEQKHFSFLVRRNKIVSIGINSKFKSHAAMARWKYMYDKIHSEAAVILKFPYPVHELNKYTLINTRINRLGKLCISYPCQYCLRLLADMNVRKVIYTDCNGNFVEL